MSKSRLNTFSATVDVDMAFGFIEKILKELDPATAKPSTEPKVLIVAPYKAHIKLIHKLIDLGYESRGFKDNLGLIRAGTVHSFQGNEAEIVIFDLVVDEPHFRANLFMPDDEVDGDQKKLFNVAVTRAKFELFIVGDFKFMQQRAKNNALGALLDMLINIKRLQKIDVKEFLPNLVFSRPTSAHFKGDINNCQIICKETDYLEYLQRDIATFKNRMIIYSPFITERRLTDLLPFFADAVNQEKKIAVVTKDISERGKRELESYKKCEKELTALGVEVIHKKGMHEKLVFVDSDAVWVGSLNSLSFTGETGEIMHRLGDKGITAEYEKIYNIAHIGSVVENPYEHRCPVCGGDMILKEGRKGSPYWECENEDYKRNVDRQYPVDGYLRCSCGAIYKFSMKNEPRWVCSENPNHSHRKISYYDLKLEKMYALIPRGDRKAVKEYFAKKQAEKEAEKAEKEKEKKKTTKSRSKDSAKKSTSRNTKTKGSSKAKNKEEKPEQKGTEQMTLLDL